MEQAHGKGDGKEDDRKKVEHCVRLIPVIRKFGEAAVSAACIAEYGFPLTMVFHPFEAIAIEKRLNRHGGI